MFTLPNKIEPKGFKSKEHKALSQTSSQLINNQNNQAITLTNTNYHHGLAPPPQTKNQQKNEAPSKHQLSDEECVEILDEIKLLVEGNQNIESINLLRLLKENITFIKNINISICIVLNLAILYYQVGFLEEAFQEFHLVQCMLQELIKKIQNNADNSITLLNKKITYQQILAKILLQVCILFSEMGKHNDAISYAKNAAKIYYNLIYQKITYANYYLKKSYKNFKQKQEFYRHNDSLFYYLNILYHLVQTTRDLRHNFLVSENSKKMEQSSRVIEKYWSHLEYKQANPIHLDKLYKISLDESELLQKQGIEQQNQFIWIYKTKILDKIQLEFTQLTDLQSKKESVSRNEVIEAITHLSISLYCFSTQTRFIEKSNKLDSHDVMDSEHWLSRSLQIAYMFLPSQAPILNQILTVHDRFHGLDKQTIPEDEEVTGFFKILKPLNKPRSTYNSKHHICSPIMIRIQPHKLEIEMPNKKQHRSSSTPANIDEFNLDKLKNNKIHGLTNGIKKIQFLDLQPISNRLNLSSRSTIDHTYNIPSINTQNNFKIIYQNKKNKSNHKEKEKQHKKMHLQLSQLNGKAIISEDLLGRPHSYDHQMLKNTNNFEEVGVSQTERKRKSSLPVKKYGKRPGSIGATIKFQGLQLTGKKMDQNVETDFFEKLHNESKIIENARNNGGNVYINNNINLYISKNTDLNPIAPTHIRGQVQKSDKQINRRQIFMNKRRSNNFISNLEDF